MKRQRQRAAARAQGYGAAREITLPLPLKGEMTEAKTAEISGYYAGELINWRSSGVSLRLRSQHTQTETGDPVLQAIPFEFGAAQEYLSIYEDKITASTGEHARDFSTAADVAFISSHAIIADGNGSPVLYNGQTFSDGVFTTETSLKVEQFDGVIGHQDRIFFWKTGDDLDFYYGENSAITGELVRFPLGRLGNITGAIMCLKSLTVDAGHGMNDTLAIFTTTGQIVAYEGANPGDSDDWRQLTRMKVAPPVSKRAFVEVGSDVWMLTAQGIVSLQSTLSSSALALVNTVSSPIQEKLVDQIAEGGEWSMHLTADATAIIINRVFDGVASQSIYRTDTKSWFEADYPARDWHNLGLTTYFTTLDGEQGTLGAGSDEAITARWVSSWFRLQKSGGITYLKPTIIAKGPLEVKVVLLSDHDATGLDISEAEQTVTIEPDNPADPNGRVALNELIAVDGVGEVFQLQMEVTATWAELVHIKAGVQ